MSTPGSKSPSHVDAIAYRQDAPSHDTLAIVLGSGQSRSSSTKRSIDASKSATESHSSISTMVASSHSMIRGTRIPAGVFCHASIFALAARRSSPLHTLTSLNIVISTSTSGRAASRQMLSVLSRVWEALARGADFAEGLAPVIREFSGCRSSYPRQQAHPHGQRGMSKIYRTRRRSSRPARSAGQAKRNRRRAWAQSRK